ncbi:MAG: GlxA family transcriptional regulator [Actinomycetota bacterium]|nr:GlxA family transcriptional regulator [Actinomycetota bacterium]
MDILIFPGVQSLDAVGPFEVFAGANEALESLGRTGLRYVVTLRATGPGPIRSESGLMLSAEPLAGTAPHTFLVAGGWGVLDARHDAGLHRWLRRHEPKIERVASVCSGAFILAQAGLLDGRRATTHWTRVEQLKREYPAVQVEPDAVYVKDGTVWTSAGVTAGIDLALALVEADHGAEVAQLVARWLVVFLRRPGGQSQFATGIWSTPHAAGPAQRAIELIRAEPERSWSVARLAEAVGVSERHLSRLFLDSVGVTPAKYVERVRVEAAKLLLETTPAGVEQVARQCGFTNAEALRRTFLRCAGVAPSDYRSRFSL